VFYPIDFDIGGENGMFDIICNAKLDVESERDE